jgi:hypothetical protein
MSTLLAIKNLIDLNYPDNTTGLITPALERQVLKALADFVVSSQGEVSTSGFVYDAAFTYDAGDPVIYNSAWYLSLVGSNLNNQPDESPTEWEAINAYNQVLSIYETGAVYIGELILVIRDGFLYQLDRAVVGDTPFVSTDFTAELAANKWVIFTGGEQGPPGADGADGVDGKEVEFQVSATHIQWRYVGDATWVNLIALSAITGADGAPGAPGADGADGTNGTNGADGADGREIELRTSGTWLQWRYVGDPSWTNLFDFSGLVVASDPPVDNTYANAAAMIAAQAGQVSGYLYYDGKFYYHYLGTTAGNITDYRRLFIPDSVATIFNVENYGAVHDGTTDDTDAIQAAINAAFSAGGGQVYFPKGVYIIGGPLLTNVGGINYNSQIYIPQIGNDTNRTTIELVGEFQPNLMRSLGISTVTEPNTGVVLRSTIQGAGANPAVIKNKGASSNFNEISYTNLQVKNISIQLTPNASNKITMGGIDCYDSAIANFEYVTVFPFNLNLVNSENPDVINVTGISMPKEATEHINTVRNCTVGGFTNGYRVGEHTSCYDAIAICCVNGFLVTESNHLPNLSKISTFWCINQITISSTAAVSPGGYYLLCQYLAVEWRSAGSWYDSINILNDPSNHSFGIINFDIVQANVGVNNNVFKKIGGQNVICRPITFNVSGEITGANTTLTYTMAFRKNKMNSGSAQVLVIPPNLSVTYDLDQEIVVQRLGSGTVEIQAGSGVTLNVPSGFLPRIKSRYDAVSIVQTAINVWSIYGALETA